MTPPQRKLGVRLCHLDVEAGEGGALCKWAWSRRGGVGTAKQAGEPCGARRAEGSLGDPEQRLPGSGRWRLDLDAVLIDVGELLGGGHLTNRAGSTLCPEYA